MREAELRNASVSSEKLISLEAEILILRHQLNIQQRHVSKRVIFNAKDRLLLLGCIVWCQMPLRP